MELNWTPEILPNIASLTPYPPGKPIEETERELGITGIIKLASNENPLGPSKKALEAIRAALPSLHLYPDGSAFQLKAALGKFLGVTPSEITVGNGSNEILDLLPRAFIPRNRNLVTHQAAFAIYRLVAQLRGCGCIEAPVDRETLAVNVDALLGAVTPDTRMVVLANPNNPTGTFLDQAEVETLARELNRRQVLLVLDYAYWEYVTNDKVPEPMAIYHKYPNVILLRTFSKIYGLAGTRVGYSVARPAITATLEKCRQPFNVSSLGLVGALAALSDQEHVSRSQALNRSSKQEIESRLARYPVKVFPCQGNFVLVDMKRPSKELYGEFLKRGVIIRPVANYGLMSHFRITAGVPEENRKLFAAMDSIFGKGNL